MKDKMSPGFLHQVKILVKFLINNLYVLSGYRTIVMIMSTKQTQQTIGHPLIITVLSTQQKLMSPYMISKEFNDAHTRTLSYFVGSPCTQRCTYMYMYMLLNQHLA